MLRLSTEAKVPAWRREQMTLILIGSSRNLPPHARQYGWTANFSAMATRISLTRSACHRPLRVNST